MKRYSKIERNTYETKLCIEIDLDNKIETYIDTKIGFFDHMLNLLAFHGDIGLKVKAIGDLNVCDHHTVEDVGIAMGNAFKEAIGEKMGINRYGSFYIPMDETLAFASLDISNRSYLVFDCDFVRESIGDMSTEMVKEFFRSFAFNAGITLHLKVLYGENDHHKSEALFKACGRALKEAKKIIDEGKLPSTKGMI